MAKTAAGLVAFCKTKLGTNYVYGMKGAVMTSSKFKQLRSMYPTTIPSTDVKKVGTVCCDCSGLISWYTGILRGSSNFKATATKVLPISRINEAVPGCAVWRSGHIGVYIGNGQIIEERGSAYGCVRTTVASRNFTHILWLKDIDYRVQVTVPEGPTVTTTANLNLRKEATSNSTSLGVIPRNTAISFLGDNGNGWSKVAYNGKTGYCSNKYLSGQTLSSEKPAVTTKTAKTTSGLNIRKQPSSNNIASLGTIPKGQEVTILEDTGFGWSRVRYKNIEGYCSNAYLSDNSLSKRRMGRFTGSGNLNIRKTTNTTCTIVQKVPSKAKFDIYGYATISGSIWYDVVYKSKRGWVKNANYIAVL